LWRRDLGAAYAFKLETKTLHPPEKFPLAAAAAITFFAVILRLAYAWRLGVSPPWPPVIASACTVPALAAVAARLGGRLAGAAAAFFWAVLPASVVASVFRPAVTYAACAGAFSLYFFAVGTGYRSRASDALWAGALVAVAAAFNPGALALAAFYFLYSTYETVRKNGAGARAFAWLGGFVAVVAAAAALEYLRTGKAFAHLWETWAAPGHVYAETNLLIKRLVADAAAMLFWDPLGFGFAVVVALAAGVYFFKNRRGDALFYAGLLVFTLAAYNFMTTSLRHYAPTALEPTKWLLAALPAAALGGAVIGELWRAGGQAALGQWTGALGAAAVLAILFLNGNMPLAPLTLLILALAVIITITLAGFARRRPEASRRRPARAAAALIILISLYPAVILYL
jgi:hypothetical protein